ncbi:MAG TPA: glutathione synthase [Candidatus Omnitrophica bacterium]|nr:MAG: glutathione synthase [Omnitrophica WOR_2 bacterium GWA2_45_18]HBR14054.1 glutathione synthase [Candidatus Omnitrophota bacterium]
MNFVFLMDPLETVIVDKDTSLLLMVGAHRRDHKVFFLPDGGMSLKNGRATFHATELIPQLDEQNPFVEKKLVHLGPDEIDVVFVRSDPPFDDTYLTNTWLLDFLPKRIPIINSPDGLRAANEKIWAAQFTTLVPPTYVGRDKHAMLEFFDEQNDIVAKPTNAFGGQSVFRIKKGDSNVHVILETLTRHGTRDIILQQCVKEFDQGDKRILLLDGEPLGAVLRVHAPGDHRNNLFSGGNPEPTRVTQRDLEIIDTLKPALRRSGLYFVGIDIIGRYLIEVNVTSPTCLQEMNRFYGVHLEEKVIAFAENLVKSA